MWGRLVAVSSAMVSFACFAVAAPAGAIAPGRVGAVTSPGSAAAPAGGTYVPVRPTRILDTRIGVGAPEGAVAAGATVNVVVGGVGGIPSTGVSVVVVNVTVTAPMDGGHVIAFAAGGSRPAVSDLSFQAAQTRAHLVVAQLGAHGQVSLYNGSAGTIELIADAAGYYTSGATTAPGAFTPVSPARLVDSRVGLGAPVGPVGARALTVVSVLGHGGVPSTGVSAVVLNVTVTSATGSGYEAIHHFLTNLSAVNFQTGITASNLAVAPVDPAGRVALYNKSAASVQLIVDVFGYFAAGAPQAAGLFGPDGPYRILDTRNLGWSPASPIPAHTTLTVPIAGMLGVPADATAVALNVTVPGGPGSGYLSVYAADTSRPVSSTVNFQSVAIANMAYPALGANGAVTIYNGSAKPANVVIDVDGYIATVPGPLMWTSPQRIDTSGMTSISCSSPTFCMAVNYDTGGETTYDGSNWSAEVPIGDTAGLDSVSCVSSTFCVVVGNGSSSHLYRDGTWTAVPIPGGYPRQVSCVSTTFCMAVDFEGAAYAFNGTSWGTPDQLIDNGARLTVSCVSATFCMAGGQQGDPEDAPAGRRNRPATPADLDTDSIFEWDGSDWGTSTTAATGELQSMNCLSADFCLAASTRASVTYDGSHWSAPSHTPPNEGLPELFTTACISSSLCLGSGDAIGAISTYTASAWAPAAALDSYGSFISISCPTSTFCVALDEKGNVVVGT